MQIHPFSRVERDDVLRRYYEAQDRYGSFMDMEKYDEAQVPDEEAERLDATYFERLPRVVMSCCPFDDKPLIRTFDPYGLDGLWWDSDACPEEPPPCRHFCVLRGAVHYNGLQAQSGRVEAHPGPEVPYVIPRLLAYPGMIAVISQLRMETGYTTYPIAYFAEKRPPVQDLTADWARTVHTYTTQTGASGWSAPVDPWDFDLMPWLEQGKIRWCPPDSDNTFLSTEPIEQCPYIDLPGKREEIIVEGDTSWSGGLPTGDPVSPLD